MFIAGNVRIDVKGHLLSLSFSLLSMNVKKIIHHLENFKHDLQNISLACSLQGTFILVWKGTHFLIVPTFSVLSVNMKKIVCYLVQIKYTENKSCFAKSFKYTLNRVGNMYLPVSHQPWRQHFLTYFYLIQHKLTNQSTYY